VAGTDTSGHVRASRHALLWLLRSLYVARLALAYAVMVRGRQARPDLAHAAFTGALFVDLAVFLFAYFAWLGPGRRTVIVDSWVRPAVLAALVVGALATTARPGLALGWARGWGIPSLLALEFVLFPAAALLLVRAIGVRPGPRPRAPASAGA
jgi:hypothetical protein